jgi:hypothetical protein
MGTWNGVDYWTPDPNRFPAGESFRVGPKNKRTAGGSFIVYEHRYEGADLLTYDGDDYFRLSIRMGTLNLVLEDTNSI